ncbi:unnamed protein product [Urochloa humidicola]
MLRCLLESAHLCTSSLQVSSTARALCSLIKFDFSQGKNVSISKLLKLKQHGPKIQLTGPKINSAKNSTYCSDFL